MDKVQKINVLAHDSGLRLARYFKRYFPHIPHSLLEKWCRKGNIRLDGKRIKPSVVLEEGQEIRLPPFPEQNLPHSKSYTLTNADKILLRQSLLYEDEMVLVLNKPQGLATQGGTSLYKHLDGLLRAFYQDHPTIHPHLVHRLDKDTTGILIVAKSTYAAQWLTQAFQTKTIRKIYWAVTVGIPTSLEGVIDLSLEKSREGFLEKVRLYEDGKKALTYYHVRAQTKSGLCWLELEPKTGRTHQLRVHCQAIGCPIVGDGKYGGSKAHPFAQRSSLHLHARSVEIPYPDGSIKKLEAPLPAHMQETFQKLGFAWD